VLFGARFDPRENGGTSQISFSPDGRKLAVSTWGIPHFLTEDPKLEEMHPSRVYVYNFAIEEIYRIRGERSQPVHMLAIGRDRYVL
jgi:hypothetical protein